MADEDLTVKGQSLFSVFKSAQSQFYFVFRIMNLLKIKEVLI